jgi:hypothetical protein
MFSRLSTSTLGGAACSMARAWRSATDERLRSRGAVWRATIGVPVGTGPAPASGRWRTTLACGFAR